MRCAVAIAIIAVAFRGEADEALARATRALEERRAAEALEIADGIVADPAFSSAEAAFAAQVWSVRGFASEAIGDPETAAESLDRALELPPGSLEASMAEAVALSLARASLEMKDGERARRALERLGSGARSKEPAAGLFALASFFEGDIAKAEAGFDAALRDGPSAESAFYLGVIRFDRGDRESALARFEEAARLDPRNYYAGIYRARALLELDRPEEAAAALGALEKLDAAFATPEARYLAGKARLRQERFAEAAALLQGALDANSSYPEACFALGTALRRLGKTDEARAALDRFQSLHRKESERLRKADALSQALLRNPRDGAAAESLARFSFESGDLEAAERSAWRALRIDPGRRDARRLLARTLSRSGRYAAAARHYQRLLKENASDAEARAELEELVKRHAKRDR
jgi:tetratricopeptide (TPR) repeat protein